MRFIDKVKISQTNLLRSKLRTFLTVSAIFIGTFTISLTNGVGNGIKAYVDQELGNVATDGVLLVQARSPQSNPISSDVVEYDPEQTTGAYSQSLVGRSDINNIRQIRGVQRIVPMYLLRAEYITSGSTKYQVMLEQYVDGYNVAMAAGRTLNVNSANEINLPLRYIEPLGFASAQDAVGKTVSIGYKNVSGQMLEQTAVIAGVMQQSLLGNSSVYLSDAAVEQIHLNQNQGVDALQNAYMGLFVYHDPNMTDEEVDSFKQLLNANGYNAQTFEDAIGVVNTIIGGILAVLNVFSAIALIAATFGIVNTLFMAVSERTSEIGLMKALGANSKTIFAIFAMEAASIGFWGALLGVGLSAGLAPLVNKIARDNFLKDFTGFDLLAFPIGPSVMIVAGIIFMAFLAGTLPSIKASRLDPIKALRYE